MVLMLAVLALALVIGAVVAGFSGRATMRGARALTEASAATHQPAPVGSYVPSRL